MDTLAHEPGVPPAATADAAERTRIALSDPVLRIFRDRLDRMYGARIERVVLYGSRARGDAHAESDYDVAVFLHDMTDRWAESDRLAEIEVALIHETGEDVVAMPFAAGGRRERTPLMHEIRKDGIDL